MTAKIVRPRDAASLILLRQGDSGLEVLLGRRGRGARFMPQRYVFPGGAVASGDSRRWWSEEEAAEAIPRMRALKRAALRETFEETGLVVGRPAADVPDPANGLSPVEAAYRAHGVRPALELLTLVGRAITPTDSPIRFHARFFVVDATHAAGPLRSSEEFDDLRWHPVAAEPPGLMQNVTQSMLRFALEAWDGRAPATPPLLQHHGERTVIRRNRPAR
jgi:8-oxo-dGTP pyrophosphatase MutT (NUDIX family)